MSYTEYALLVRAEAAEFQINRLRKYLQLITEIEDQSWGEDWCEINEARRLAREALALDTPAVRKAET